MFFIEASKPPILSHWCVSGGSMQDARVKTQDRISSVWSGISRCVVAVGRPVSDLSGDTSPLFLFDEQVFPICRQRMDAAG
jgi:hypothetical protein